MRRMSRKRGVIIIAGILILMFYMIFSSAKAYNREEKAKPGMKEFMRNPYSFGAYRKEFS